MKNKAVIFGLYAGLVLILISLVTNLLGLVDVTNPQGGLSWLINILNYAVVAVAMVLAVKNFRDNENGGVVSFGKAFGVGFTSLLTIVILTVIWSYFYFAVIDPEMLETLKEFGAEQMREQGLTEDQIESAAGVNNFILNPLGMSITAGVSMLFMGSILGLVVSAVMKKENGTMA
jgi:hypothetical protein